MSTCWDFVKKWRALMIIILTPLLLLPLPLITNTPEGRTAFALFLMAVYWVTEAVPIAVTALMPIFLFPMMNISPASVVASSYIRDLLMLFLGGLLMAVAIERWNLHRRIALRILLLVGSEPRWLMLGLMTATWLLSMWMSNTATTAMMVPITDAILQQLKGTLSEDASADMQEETGEKPEQEDKNKAVGAGAQQDPETHRVTMKHYKLMCKGMLMSICYAANSGGIATLTGTGPNLVLKRNADQVYENHQLKSPVNFASWMGFGLPLSAMVMLLCWVWLQIVFLRCRGLRQCCRRTEKEAQGNRVKAIIRQEYTKLGPISFAEGAVMFFFGMLVVLWITRDLGGAGGWGDLFAEGTVSDSTPAILLGFCLFFFPSRNPFRRQPQRSDSYSVSGQTVEIQQEEDEPLRPLLSWSDAHTKLPWSLFLLLGGGFALSDGCKVSGLSAWIGEQLEVFSDINKVAMLFLLGYITAAMTEVTSNTAISILILPILGDLALRTGVHPLYYMIPASLACSFAFMLPVATPPNAIVFAAGHVRVVDMMMTGVVMNILAVPLLVLATSTWGNAMFDFDNIPAAFLNSSAATTV